jgi:hypothetical protein
LDSDQPTHHPHSCTIPAVTCPCCAGLFGGEEVPIPFSSGHCDGESNHSSKFAGSDFGNEEAEHPSKFVGHDFGHGELTDNDDILEATDPLLSLVEELAAFSAFEFEPDLEDDEELIEFYYCSEEELDEPTSPVLCSEEFPTSDLIDGELMDPNGVVEVSEPVFDSGSTQMINLDNEKLARTTDITDSIAPQFDLKEDDPTQVCYKQLHDSIEG